VTGKSTSAGDGAEKVYFYGVIKSYDEQKGFGYIASSDFAALSGRDAYLTKEEAAAASRDPVAGPSAGSDAAAPKEGQPVKFQVTQNGDGDPQAVNVAGVRPLIGDVAQLPREGDQSGVLVIKGDPDGSEKVQSLVGKEVRFGQADCGQLMLAVGDEVLFSCSVVSESPHVLDARISELRSTSRTGPILFGNFHVEFPRSGDSVCNLGGHAMQDRIVLAGLPPDLKGPELMRLFENFKAQEPLLAREDAGPRGGFASVIFQGGPTDVAQFLLRTAIAMTVDGKARAARLGFNARAPQDLAQLPLLPAQPQPTLEAEEGGALMVRWQQVGMAVGYLVELRPFGDEAGWSPVDVSPGHHVDPHPSLPQGLLGPQCSACRVNSLREVPYEARVMYYAASGCRSYHSKVSTPCKPTPSASTRRDDGHSGQYQSADGIASTVDWRAPSGSIIPAPSPPELIPYEEPSGGRGILIQWPTITHATAYVVDLYEETSGTMESFKRAVPDNLREVLVELRVGNLQPTGIYSASVRSVAPCGAQSVPSAYSMAPAPATPAPWFPPPASYPPPAASYPPPLQSAWGPPALPSNGVRPPGVSPLLATNPGLPGPLPGTPPGPPPPPAEPPSVEHEAQLPAVSAAAAQGALAEGTAHEAAALVLD